MSGGNGRRPSNGAAHVIAKPPERGLPLGIRLGLVTSLVVVVLLGLITANQQRQELDRDRRTLERLLERSLAPLAAQVERAPSLAAAREYLDAFRAAHLARGASEVAVTLSDRNGRVLASFGAVDGDPEERLEAKVPVTAAGVGEGESLLTLAEPGRSLVANGERRWHHWRLTLLFTVLCLVVSIQVAIYLLLTRPLGRLVAQLRKLEAGYACDVEPGGGAWEIRWLGWQVHRLCNELSESARCLIRAERRAQEQVAVEPTAVAPAGEPAKAAWRHGSDVEGRLVRRYLQDRLRLLSSLGPEDPGAAAVAEEVWRRDVVEAERFGELDLRAELENRALLLLDPEAYAAVDRELSALVSSHETWPALVAEVLAGALLELEVPFLQIQHRVKHVAGVWRKAQERGLAVSEVQDVFAFRIIVADENACYAALRAVHRRFEPEPFRFKDYIAEPKANGYRSIHTSVQAPEGLVFEVQIRTLEMHQAAERGASAHWRYVSGRLDGPAPTAAGEEPGGSRTPLKRLLRRRPWRDRGATTRP
jgi:hypothetical protein